MERRHFSKLKDQTSEVCVQLHYRIAVLNVNGIIQIKPAWSLKVVLLIQSFKRPTVFIFIGKNYNFNNSLCRNLVVISNI